MGTALLRVSYAPYLLRVEVERMGTARMEIAQVLQMPLGDVQVEAVPQRVAVVMGAAVRRNVVHHGVDNAKTHHLQGYIIALNVVQ